MLIIFDFDGVIADSEYLANLVLAECVSELGVPTTLEESYQQYMGKRFEDVLTAVETTIGKPLPDTFPAEYQQRTLDQFRVDLKPVSGALEFLREFHDLPVCIASSSSPDRLRLCIEVLGIGNRFADNVYSASMVERGKPFPDIFLHAASEMGHLPKDCVVIEDSPSGVEAGIAAGMTVIGLTAASHIQPDHAEKLRASGAHYIASNYGKAADLMRIIT
ncbi:MAG: HAD-IA family hydrolase [Pseudomonadota bacterium]